MSDLIEKIENGVTARALANSKLLQLILPLVVFFLVGILLLLRVPQKEKAS